MKDTCPSFFGQRQGRRSPCPLPPNGTRSHWSLARGLPFSDESTGLRETLLRPAAWIATRWVFAMHILLVCPLTARAISPRGLIFKCFPVSSRLIASMMSAGVHASMKRNAESTAYSRSHSMLSQSLPSFSATDPVVFEPEKTSTTQSPGSVRNSMKNFGKAAGNLAGWPFHFRPTCIRR